MTIKNNVEKNGVIIESLSKSINVYSLDNGSLRVEVDGLLITSPGEYEISGIALDLLEIPLDKHLGNVNYVHINVETINFGIICSSHTSLKDFLKDSLDIEILVILSSSSIEASKKAISFFEPQYLVFCEQKNGVDLQKEYNLANLEVEKSLKLKESDIVKSENFVQKNYILK